MSTGMHEEAASLAVQNALNKDSDQTVHLCSLV